MLCLFPLFYDSFRNVKALLMCCKESSFSLCYAWFSLVTVAYGKLPYGRSKRPVNADFWISVLTSILGSVLGLFFGSAADAC
jgi:hypothetical protein